MFKVNNKDTKMTLPTNFEQVNASWALVQGIKFYEIRLISEIYE